MTDAFHFSHLIASYLARKHADYNIIVSGAQKVHLRRLAASHKFTVKKKLKRIKLRDDGYMLNAKIS
jgi:cytidylate kinase